MSNEVDEFIEFDKISRYDIVKNSYHEFDGNEDEKCVEIICEFFLTRKSSKESFDYTFY